MIRRLAPLLLAGVLLATGCGGDDDTTAERPPLGSPPDPGPAPDDDGLSDGQRETFAESTVRISGVACGRNTEGSGFVVADDLIATNAHVVLGLPRPTIGLIDGETVEGEVVAFDAIDDLALVRVADLGLEPLPLGTADDGTVGAVFGWEEGPRVDPTPFRIDRPVTVRIEAVASDERIERRSWLVAAEIEAGDSGAALVDRSGRVVGVAYATTTRGSSVAYAVRAMRLEALIDAGFNANLTIPDC